MGNGCGRNKNDLRNYKQKVESSELRISYNPKIEKVYAWAKKTRMFVLLVSSDCSSEKFLLMIHESYFPEALMKSGVKC